MVKTYTTSLFLLATAALHALAAPATTTTTQSTIYAHEDELIADSLTNVYLDYGSTKVAPGTMTLSFGSCDSSSTDGYHEIGTVEVTKDFKPTKFIWAVPADAKQGCITATDASGKVIASSKAYNVSTKISKRGFPEFEGMHFDAVKFHKERLSKRKNVAANPKDTSTYSNKLVSLVLVWLAFSIYLLDQAGFHNYEIIEANDRLGGCVHTTYFSNSSIAYQEMGPMRFPVAFNYKNKTLPVTDHNIVFQLADELNKINDESYKIEFIKWIQSMENNLYYYNGKRLPNGKVPTKGQVIANATLAQNAPEALADKVDAATEVFYGDKWNKIMGEDLYKAHAKALEEGYDDWSEWGWIHNKMGLSLNATDYATGLDAGNIWEDMYDTFTFSATDWRTIQGGLNRLPEAFGPVLGDKVTFNTRVTKLDFDGKQVSVEWKDKPYDEEYNVKKFDNVIVAIPFSIVRTWHLPELSYTLKQAIKNLGYSQACKVALEFKTRFWEHYELPIKGGCDSTDLYVGSICYPSNNIGTDGPGVMLASYASGDPGLRLASMTEDEHIARVLEDIVELHGDIVKEQYTGNYDRRCWILDPFQSGSWASALPGQHKLYMPSYFEMNSNLVFVGEHTDIKHAWISAALESAVRGVVMVLVEHGHVKEAKEIVKHWNASWMKI